MAEYRGGRSARRDQGLRRRPGCGPRPGRCLGHHPRERVLHPAGPVGLRQDHAAAADRRLRAADRGRDPARRRADIEPSAALSAAGQHGVPELRAVPAHDGRRRTSPSGCEMQRHGRGRDRPARSTRCWRWCSSAASAGRQPSAALGRPAAARGAGPRARQPARRCCCSTSRSSALDLKLRKEMQIELKQLQRETGITFIFVTHDQEEALTMSRPHRGHERRPDPADRHAATRSTSGRRTASSPTSSARPISSRPSRGRPADGDAALPRRRWPADLLARRPAGRSRHHGRPWRCGRSTITLKRGGDHRHVSTTRLFRHRHELRSCGWATAAPSSSACRTRVDGRAAVRGRRQGGHRRAGGAARVLQD